MRAARATEKGRVRETPAELCAAALILLGSAWLRFSRLGSQGLYSWDEMYLAVHARIFADFFRAALRGGPALYQEVARTGGLWHVTAAKPAHYALMTLAALVGGGGDLPLQAVSACFGTTAVAIVYLWGRRWSVGAGLCAAALLGGLGGHVWYSRGLLAAAPASTLLLLGAFLSLRTAAPSPRGLVGAGLSLGTAIAMHYNVLPAAAAILLYMAVRRQWRNASLTAAAILLPLLGWEALSLVRNSWSPRPMLDYAGELRHYLFLTSRRDSSQAWVPSLLLRWVVLSSGAVPAFLLVAGALASAVEPRKRAELLPIAALGPGMFLVWSAASLWWAQVARPVANLLPFLCLCAGVGWGGLEERLTTRRARSWTTAAAASLLFAVGLPGAEKYALTVSPYKRAGDDLRAHPGSVAAWTPLIHYYAPDSPYIDAASSLTAADAVVVDFHAPAGVVFDKPPRLVLPFSRFDSRVACLEETVRPDACLRGELASQDAVAVFDDRTRR